MARAYLLLGSNIAPKEHLWAALSEIVALGCLCGISPVYQTTAVGNRNQPDFLNAALCLDTALGAEELRTGLRAIEARHGRVRGPDENAPRTLDIDILWYGADGPATASPLVTDPEAWRLPHVLAPLADIAANLPHPLDDCTVGEATERLDCSGVRQRSDITLMTRQP